MTKCFTRHKHTDRKSWLEMRKDGLGGSDAACVMGLNPWKNNVDLWREKVGLVEPEDISGKQAVKYGHEAEGSLRQLFRLDFPEYKLHYRNNEILRNKKLPYLQASVDGELEDKEGRKGILEIKTTTIAHPKQREDWKDRVPDHYFCQILHYFNVTGYEFAVLKAQLKYIYSDRVRLVTNHYFFEREELMDDLIHLLKAEITFWKSITEKQEPSLLLPPL